MEGWWYGISALSARFFLESKTALKKIRSRNKKYIFVLKRPSVMKLLLSVTLLPELLALRLKVCIAWFVWFWPVDENSGCLFSLMLWLSFSSLNNVFWGCIHIDLRNWSPLISFHCWMVLCWMRIPQLIYLSTLMLMVIWIVSRSLLWTFFCMGSGAQVQEFLRTHLGVKLLECTYSTLLR